MLKDINKQFLEKGEKYKNISTQYTMFVLFIIPRISTLYVPENLWLVCVTYIVHCRNRGQTEGLCDSDREETEDYERVVS